MKIKFLIITLLISFFSGSEKEEFSYSLPEFYKLKNTVSVKIAGQRSLHLAIAKNKNSNQYDLVPFVMNQNGKVNKLSTLRFEDEPELVSFHINDNQLTLINFQDDQLIIDDVDLEEGSTKRKLVNEVEKPKNIITEDHETLFIKADRKENNLKVTRISNSENIQELNMQVPSNLQDKFKHMFETNPQIINTAEFVKNGSIAKLQAYYGKNKINLVFNEQQDDQNISLLSINLEGDNNFELKNFKTPEMDKLKNSNSFLKEEQLFVINSSKEDIELNVFSTEKENLIKNLSLKNDLSYLAENQEELEDFIKNSRKNRNKPTVTINETKNGKLAVRMDYVDTKTYNYYDIWWLQWQMQWQMQIQMHMQQQQMMNQVPTSFGPNITSLDIDELYTKEESHSYTLVLNKDLQIQKNEENIETKHPDIDIKKYKERVEEMEKELKIENTSLSFLDTTYRLFYSDKKKNVIHIKTLQLD